MADVTAPVFTMPPASGAPSMPPPSSSPEAEAPLLIPGVSALARVMQDRNHLGGILAAGEVGDLASVLSGFLYAALEGNKGAAQLAKVILDRALPPAPSRAETWWLKAAPAAGIPPDATLDEISAWLNNLVTMGELTPAIAAELVGQFRVLEAAGGLKRKVRTIGR